MATLHFSNEMRAHTGGVEAVTIEAPRVQDLLREVVARFPELAGTVEDMAVAIDGAIHQDAAYVDLEPASEVYLVPRLAGG